MSNIEWTEKTWNPVTGCTPVSDGCKHCYAASMAKRLQGMGQARYANGFKVTCHPEALGEPLRWKKPSMVFVCSMGDPFHEDVPYEFIADVLDICCEARCERHTFQVLTKRPRSMVDFFGWAAENWPGDSPLSLAMEVNGYLPNVWLGVSVENQKTADERIPYLLKCSAAVRFLSVEPMLEPIDLGIMHIRSHRGSRHHPTQRAKQLHWVIVGGESGPEARPMNLDWVRDIAHQCAVAGVPLFVKQLGSAWAAKHGLRGKGQSKGQDPASWPEHLRIREYPNQQDKGEST